MAHFTDAHERQDEQKKEQKKKKKRVVVRKASISRVPSDYRSPDTRRPITPKEREAIEENLVRVRSKPKDTKPIPREPGFARESSRFYEDIETARREPRPSVIVPVRAKEKSRPGFLWGVPESVGRAAAVVPFALTALQRDALDALPDDLRRQIPVIGPMSEVAPPILSEGTQHKIVEKLIGDDTLARDWIIGPETYNYLTGKPYNPYLLAAELGSWALGTGISRAGFAAARAPVAFGIVAGKNVGLGVRGAAKAGAEAAASELGKGSATARGVRWGARRISAKWRDPLNSNVLGFRSPAAKNALGRRVENFIDRHLSTEGMRTRRAAKFQKEKETTLRRLDLATASTLKKYAKKLSIEENYAIRALAANVHPDERRAFHLAEMTARPSLLEQYAHSVHADLNALARKYVTTITNKAGEQEVVLREDAPDRLKKAWEYYQKAYGDRERILTDLDELLDETVRERIDATGKIMKGGEWVENEVWAQKQLLESPHRAKLAEALETEVSRGALTREQADALLVQMDLLSKARAQNLAKSLKKKGKRLEKRLTRLLEAAEDDLTGKLDPKIREVEEKLREIDSLLEEGIPPDVLYMNLHEAGVGFPDWFRNLHEQGYHERGVSLDYRKSKGNPKKEIDPRIAEARKLAKAKDPGFFEAGKAIIRDLALAAWGARDWYTRSANRILAVSHDDLELADKLAQLAGIYSAQREVVDNTGMALNAYMQWKRTGKVALGTGPQRKDAQGVLEGTPWDGRKTNTFYRNILEEIDPKKYAEIFAGDDVTVDRHMLSMVGLGKNDSAYYDLVQDMVREVAAELGVKPKEVQAAAWVRWKQLELMRRRPKLTEEEAWKIANTSFDEAMDVERYVTRFPVGAISDLSPEFKSLTREQQIAYTRAKAQGLNEFFRELELPATVRDEPGPGFWIDENRNVQVNPAVAVDLHSGISFSMKTAGELKKKHRMPQLPRDEKALYDLIALTIGRAFNQEAASWFKPIFAASKKQVSMARLHLGRPVSDEEMNRLAEVFADKNVWFSHADDGVWIAHGNPRFGRTEAFQKKVVEAADRLGVDDDNLVWYAHNSNYLGVEDAREALERALGDETGSLGRAFARLHAWSDEVDRAFREDPEGAARAFGGAGGEPGPALAARAGDLDRVLEGVFVPWTKSGGHIPEGKSAVYVNPRTKEPLETWVHELGHFIHAYGLSEHQVKRLAKHYGDLAGADPAPRERLVEDLITYYLSGGPPASIARDAKGAFKVLADGLAEEHRASGGAMRAVVPREVREILDFLHEYEALKGGKIRGPEHTGKAKEPFKRGLPLPLRKGLRDWRMYIAFYRSGHGAIGKMWSDPTVRKQMKGLLLKSGLFTADVLRSAGEEFAKAAKLASVMRTRRDLLKMSTKLPKDARAIAIKVKPDLKVSQALARYQDLVNAVDSGMDLSEALASMGLSKSKLFSKQQLADLEESELDNFVRELFPSGPEIDELKGALLRGERGEVENIRWIDPDLLGELFNPPGLKRMQKNLWKKAARASVFGIDLFNDVLRIMLLFANPAYYPVNMLGNLAMNLSQQGFLTLWNLPLAMRLNHALDLAEVEAIDLVMGKGFSGAMELRAVAGKPSQVLANAASLITDRAFRRAAWLHEARRLGYKDPEALSRLIRGAKEGREDAVADFLHITQSAKKEIVDFDNLTDFERDVLSRIIFVYPWLKGATMYTLNFPLNHPATTLALLAGYARQQEMANREVGARPDYLNLYLPIGTAERFGEEYPYGINLRQVFTQSTPVDIARALTGFVTGKTGSQPLTEFAQPFYSTALSHITGYDPFLDKKVDTGVVPLLKDVGSQLTIKSPLGQGIERIIRSDEERRRMAEEGALYPRSKFDDWFRTLLGTIATGPVNPETAGRRAREGKAQSSADKMQSFLEDAKRVLGHEPPPFVINLYGKKLRYEEIQSEVRKELGTGKLGPKGVALARIRLAAETFPQFNLERAEASLETMSDEAASEWSDAIWEALGLDNEAYRWWIKRVEGEE